MRAITIRMEVAEGAVDHRRIDVAEHAAAAEEVEAVAVEAELLAARHGLGHEVERSADVAGLLGDREHHLAWVHASCTVLRISTIRLGGVVGVVALGGQQRGAVLGRLALGERGVGLGDRGVDAVLVDELGPLDEGVDHLRLGHDGDVAALDEQVAALVAGGDAEVGFAGFAGTVDDASHHRHLERQLALAERRHRPLGDVDHVDLGAAARRARDQVDVLALAQTERLEQLAAGPRLLDRIGGQRVADRVADALHQQGGDAGRPLDQPGRRRTGLGHAEVERVVGDLAELPVGLDHQRHARRLDRDLDQVEPDLVEVGDLLQRRLDHRLGRRPAVLLVQRRDRASRR